MIAQEAVSGAASLSVAALNPRPANVPKITPPTASGVLRHSTPWRVALGTEAVANGIMQKWRGLLFCAVANGTGRLRPRTLRCGGRQGSALRSDERAKNARP